MLLSINAIFATSNLVLVIIGLFGLAMLGMGAWTIITLPQCKQVEAEIVNIRQEYTARGFINKAELSYELDGRKFFYITKARTFKRGTDTIILHVNQKGKVVEPSMAYEQAIIGVVAIIIAAYALIKLF